MREKTLYFVIGALVSLIVMLVARGPLPAEAQHLLDNGTGIAFTHERRFLDENGAVWTWDQSDANRCDPDGWEIVTDHAPYFIPPVPVADIKHWGLYWLITQDNTLWVIAQYVPDGVVVCQEWKNLGPWPGGPPVPVQESTWGSIKAKSK